MSKSTEADGPAFIFGIFTEYVIEQKTRRKLPRASAVLPIYTTAEAETARRIVEELTRGGPPPLPLPPKDPTAEIVRSEVKIKWALTKDLDAAVLGKENESGLSSTLAEEWRSDLARLKANSVPIPDTFTQVEPLDFCQQQQLFYRWAHELENQAKGFPTPASSLERLTLRQLSLKVHRSEQTLRRAMKKAGVPPAKSGQHGRTFTLAEIQAIEKADVATGKRAAQEWQAVKDKCFGQAP